MGGAKGHLDASGVAADLEAQDGEAFLQVLQLAAGLVGPRLLGVGVGVVGDGLGRVGQTGSGGRSGSGGGGGRSREQE
jgi:hypothetical protein